MINKALRRWEANPLSSIKEFAAHNAPDQRFNLGFPVGGLILRETIRDLPRVDNENFETWRHNFDHAWLTADEMNSFVPSNPEVGHKYQIPEKFARRFAAFHLVDQVKGEADAWKRSEVQMAIMEAEVMKQQDDKVQIRLHGAARCVKPATGEVNPYSRTKINQDRGVDLNIRGWLTYDTNSKSFTRFDVIAAGDRWGAATYNFRSGDLGRAPIGFAFEMLPVVSVNKTRPKFLMWSYFN